MLCSAHVSSSEGQSRPQALWDRNYVKWQNQLQEILTSSKMSKGSVRYRSIGYIIVLSIHDGIIKNFILLINRIVESCWWSALLMVLHTAVFQQILRNPSLLETPRRVSALLPIAILKQRPPLSAK